MISRTRTLVIAGSAAVLTGLAVLGTAVAAPVSTLAAATVAGDEIPYAIESFEYPNAAKILTEQGIKLVKGDGHLLLADCRGAYDIAVMTSISHPGQTERGKYCFDAIGTSGWLSLEVPKVYNIYTGDVAVRAQLTAEGSPTQTVDVAKNDMVGVGVGANPPGAATTLVELRITG